MVISKIILVSLSIVYASAGYSQFYISPHFATHINPAFPIHHEHLLAPQITQNSAINFPSFYQSQPLLFSQNVNPFIQHTFPTLPQVTVEQARSSNRESSGRSLETAQPYSAQGTEFGFGYRTQFDDGASSTVVFVSGPDSKRMSLLRNSRLTARKLASDILDAKTSDEKNEKINHALSDNIPGLNFDALIEAFPSFKPLGEEGTSYVNLFSHPADFFPLPQPAQTTTSSPASSPASDLASDDDSESIAVDSADNDTPLARSNESSEKEAESIIQETKILIDDIKNRSANETSSTETSSQSSSTSSSSTSTEESTTAKSEEIETTTQV
ncbi:serine-rich adhesin for platelets-like [Harmonia axyridis]|uniref:serine-rich adhesin for platelets-like n=1 Tax=Harmonia axyridis TaxID=115357 RepID=UPI001E278221|nr:serine-rich adhesin for platelets-like [Harmonia axyridis]